MDGAGRRGEEAGAAASIGGGTGDDPGPNLDPEAIGDAVLATTTGRRGCGPMSIVMLGIVLLLLGGLVGWAEDVAAPYVNLGETDLPGTVDFDADDATYVVITSGPTRPLIEQTGCTITRADGKVIRDRGREGVEGGRTRLGVTRVLEFDAVAGPTKVRCGFTFDPDGGNGRMQVVAADGPVHTAYLGLLGVGGLLLLGGIAWLVAAIVRRPRPSPATA